jgi:predicted DNA-binding transcriptional regulator AlpA
MKQELDDYPLEDRVMSFSQWCKLTDISIATGRRLVASGEGPRILRLSARRIGIRLSDHRAWLEARSQQGTSL